MPLLSDKISSMIPRVSLLVLFQIPVRGAREIVSLLFDGAASAIKSFALVNASDFIISIFSGDVCNERLTMEELPRKIVCPTTVIMEGVEAIQH